MTGLDDTTSSWVATRPLEDIDTRAILERWWGRSGGVVQPLPSERDRNILVRTAAAADVDAVVLKVSNLAEEPDFLDCQGVIAAVLADAGLPVARPIPALDGRDVIGLGDPGPPFARLLPWLPGRPLATIGSPSDALLADLGRLLGRVALALRGIDHPAAHRTFQWDIRQAVDVIGADLGDVADPDRRRLLTVVLEALRSRMVPAIPMLRMSLIHNDANDHNVLVDETGTHVVGLLDLGDLLHSVTVHDAAVATAYAMLLRDDPVSVVGPLIGAFDAAFPLTDAEVEALPDLVVARLGTSVAVSAHQGRLDPDPYLRVSETPAWTVLATLWAVGHGVLRDAVHSAVGR